MPGQTLSSLPTDIIKLIVDQISHKPDLVTLCLTCRKLQEAAVVRLYKAILLKIGAKDDSRITQMLTPENKGLQYIRYLTLECANEDNYSLSQIHFVFATLLQMLPRDSLVKFHWQSWKKLPSKCVELLMRTQRKLNDLETVASDDPMDDQFWDRVGLDDISQSAKMHRLYLDSEQCLKFAHRILKHAAQPLDKLRIHSNFPVDSEVDHAKDDPMQDTEQHLGKIYKTVLAPLRRDNPDSKFKVKSLRLDSLGIYHASSWMQSFDTAQLTSLTLSHCAGTPAALSELCRLGTSGLNLKTLYITHCERAAGDDARGAIQTFLTVASGLQSISIDLCCSTFVVRPRYICRHADTLKKLNLYMVKEHDSKEPGWWYYDQNDTAELANHLTHVEQLAIPCMNSDITDGLKDGELGEMLEALSGPNSQLNALQTLQFLSWPTSKNFGGKVARNVYDQLLGITAKELLSKRNHEAKKLPKLSCVAWGAKTDDENSMTVFVGGTSAPLLGQPSLEPVHVTQSWVEHNHYGRASMLDWEHVTTLYPQSVKKRDATQGHLPLGASKKPVATTTDDSETTNEDT